MQCSPEHHPADAEYPGMAESGGRPLGSLDGMNVAHSVRVDGRDVHGGRGDRPDEHPPSSALWLAPLEDIPRFVAAAACRPSSKGSLRQTGSGSSTRPMLANSRPAFQNKVKVCHISWQKCTLSVARKHSLRWPRGGTEANSLSHHHSWLQGQSPASSGSNVPKRDPP